MPSPHSPGALADVTLPDGRRIVAPNPQQAGFLWQSVSQDPYYGAGAAELTGGDVVLDIGANIGLTTLHFVAQAPGLRVIAAEPAAASYSALAVNLARHAPGCTAVHSAVGSVCGSGEFTYYPDSPANSTLHADFDDTVRVGHTYLGTMQLPAEIRAARERAVVAKFRHTVTTVVPITTISELLHRFRIDRVALLKIDVERAELEVAQGITAAHWRGIDRVVAEAHDVDGRVGQLVDLLAERGFRTEVEQDPAMAGTNLYMVSARR
ncbi:FkbM family methyltransferase [Nocardia sp. NPDC020380]|uniref:FkbM family methyltransferase n=1 Tax=Nocardia sp. NPDC020380 TaxID=3364309 RepID=UPI0037BD3C5F